MEERTVWQALFDLMLWGVIFITLFPAIKYPYRLPKLRKYIGLFLILLFCLFPFFGGDYFHYRLLYENATIKGGYSHFEEVYVWIIQNLCNSYFQFRLIVWGTAILLTIMAYRRLETDSDLPIFYLGVFYLPWFSYARVSLAMAFIIFGLSFFAKPPKRLKLLGIIICLLAMGVSIFFHRSAIIGIIAALCSILLGKTTKNKVILIVAIFPLLLIFIESLLIDFMSLELTYDDYISGKHRDYYLNGGASGGFSMGVGPFISVFFTRAPLFVVAVTFIYSVVKGFIKKFDMPSRVISFYAFLVVLISFTFIFNLGFNTYTLYYRTLNFAMIPSVLFLTQLKKLGYASRLYKLIYGSTIFGVFYTLLYSVYATL